MHYIVFKSYMLEYATHRKILEKGQKVGRCTAEEYFFRELQRWFECLKKELMKTIYQMKYQIKEI